MNVQNYFADQARHVVPRVVEAGSSFSRIYRGLLAGLGAAFLLASAPAFAIAVAPDLGTAYGYTVLGTNASPTVGTVTCSDSGPGTFINGDVGSTFNSITQGACVINGAIVAPVLPAVVNDFSAAFAAIDTDNPVCDGVIPIVDTTLPPGVYCSDAGTTIPAGVTLTLNGSASDVWVFRVGILGPGALTLTSGQVVMSGTAQACNVYWKTSAGMTVTDSASFVGTVLSGAAATMTRTDWNGRVMATTDVTLTDPAAMTFAGCAAPATITVNKNFIPDNVATVPVFLACTSGTVTTAPPNVSEATPAVFTVGAASPGATCTATETVPPGYTADQTGCVAVPLNGSCTITNTLAGIKTLTLRKTWVNALVGETATVTSLGFANNATSGLSISTGNNTTTGSAVTVSTGETGTISEVLSNPGNYTSALTCTGNANALVGNLLTVNAADTDILCTETNTLIPLGASTLTLRKAWVNALVGETATVTSLGFANNATSGLSTSTGNNTTTGSAVIVFTGETGTISEVLSNPGNYTSALTCTGNANALVGNSLTVNAADTAIVCTETNTYIPIATAVPTLSEWAMIMLAAFLAITGFAAMRRQTR